MVNQRTKPSPLHLLHEGFGKSTLNFEADFNIIIVTPKDITN